MLDSYLIKSKILSENIDNLSSSSLYDHFVKTQTDNNNSTSLNIISANSRCYSMVMQELAKLENHFDPFFSFVGYLASENLVDFKNLKERVEFRNDNIMLSDSKEILSEFVEMSRSNRTTHTVVNVSPRAEKVVNTNLINIGFSRHNTPQSIFTELNMNQSISIGNAKNDIQNLEPLLRDAKFARIDLSIIDAVITGFTIFEVCTIMKYLGHANHLDLVLLDGDASSDSRYYEKVALLTWYFLEGRQHRQNDYPQNPKNKTYMVYSETTQQDFEFSKSEISGRWWLKNPTVSNEYISISFEEYTSITEDNIPQRIIDLF